MYQKHKFLYRRNHYHGVAGNSYVDDEIMEYDGRDYNKDKACFPIVKKDNKKGKNEIY